tara:strand:- start:1689 stop:2426 length:738 start_codon:yes stop_codon:yes gene_type:complete
MSDKFNDILSEIKNTRSVLKVIVPSKQVEVELSPLTLAQQKLIIETTSDTTLGVLFFNNVFYKILKENIKGNISDYNTVDRVNLTLALRQHLKDVIGTDDNEITVTDLLERNKTLTYSIEPIVITSGDFTFNVEAPSLDVDNFINTHLLNKYKNVTFDENKLKNLISDLYACEILKFIKSIKINDKEITLHNELTPSIKVLESIDSIHFIQVTEYINSIRDEEAKYTKYVDSEKSVDITPDLFIL